MKIKSLTVKLAALLCACGFAFSAWANVAQIGETKYETLQAAIADAVDGDTIELLTGVEIASTVSLDKVGTYIIDGKGKSILH